jgi:hypothetical protein
MALSGREHTICTEPYMDSVKNITKMVLSRADTITCTENYMDFWNTVGLMVFRNLNLIFLKLDEIGNKQKRLR